MVQGKGLPVHVPIEVPLIVIVISFEELQQNGKGIGLYNLEQVLVFERAVMDFLLKLKEKGTLKAEKTPSIDVDPVGCSCWGLLVITLCIDGGQLPLGISYIVLVGPVSVGVS